MVTSWRKLILFLFLCAIAGSIFTIFIVRSDIFVRWKLASRPPDNIAEVLGGDSHFVYIKSSDNQVYSCGEEYRFDCWIPDVFTGYFEPKACDGSLVAFWPTARPPKNIISCAHTSDSYDDVIYALDSAKNLWEWHSFRSGIDFYVYPLLALGGALAGLLLGSIAWIILSLSMKEKVGVLTRGQIVVLLCPWLCLIIVGGFFWAVQRYIFPSNDLAEQTRYEAINQSIATGSTQASLDGLAAQTPNPFNPFYTFTSHYCKAQWLDGGLNPLPCNEGSQSSDAPVVLVQNPLLEGHVKTGPGLKIHLTPDNGDVYGEYPRMAIQEGDHFRATIGCLDQSPECNVIFTVSYEVPDQLMGTIGNWQQTLDGQTEEIDIDLSRLAGKKVIFTLGIYSLDNVNKFAEPVWLNPRIERVYSP